MPLLDIATPQPSFRNNLSSLGFQRLRHVSGNQKTARWRHFRLSDKPNRIFYINPASLETCRRCRGRGRAVATLEPRCSDEESADNDNESSHEKEKLIRETISKAGKAWNRGKKSSPETRRKQSEMSRSPMVRMKTLRTLQERSGCHLQWLNLIAEASRKGLCGEEELQWDSYEIISQQLEKERLERELEKELERETARIECENTIPFNRLPKSLGYRRKMSAAMTAKWNDPVYRDRVESALARRHNRNTGDPPKRPKKKDPKKIKSVKRDGFYATRIRNSRPNLTTSKRQIHKEPRPIYKDPQAGYKLEMIKSIRAQRAASDPKIIEAVTIAKVLIGEAQRAAEALEVAAAKSPTAEASLVELRKLIGEAMSYIKSIETVNTGFPESGSDEDVKTPVEGVSEIEQIGVNGGLSDAEIAKMVNIGVEAEIAKFGQISRVVVEDEDVMANGTASSSSSWGLQTKEAEENGGRKMAPEKEGGKGKGRRWVCGRLVEDGD